MKQRRLWGLIALAVALAPMWAAAQSTPVLERPRVDPAAIEVGAPLAARVAERIEREMAAQGIVGLAVAMARGGEIVHADEFGWADRENEVEVTGETMFRWASVSKPLTAVVAMQLAKEGKLDLDADVRKLVPEFPEKPFVITPRQLLTHQGGIVHYGNGPVIRTARTYTDPHPFKDVVVALDMFAESPLVCEPKTKHEYTTHGYMLLGAAVQRAGGEELATLVRKRVNEPLGLTTLRPDYQWENIPHRAKGYRKDKEGEVVRSTDTDVSWKLAGGGWISNARDMAMFGEGMLGEKLVDPETRAAMWTPQRVRSGEVTRYGLGFGVRERGGELEVSHSGAQEKTATFLLIRPEAEGGGVVVAVLCNTEGSKLSRLARDLAGLMQPEPAGVGNDDE